MYAARILYPVEVLGPGKRIAIWFAGCPHHCRGCSNPELWESSPSYEIATERVIGLMQNLVKKYPADGLTLTGGDPFFQPQALLEIVKAASLWTKDILVYTGYSITDLQMQNDPTVQDALSKIAVLIDGIYIPEQNGTCPLRGSDNQRIHIFRPELQDIYSDYLQRDRQIQNFMQGNAVISVGLHRSDFKFSSVQKEASE